MNCKRPQHIQFEGQNGAKFDLPEFDPEGHFRGRGAQKTRFGGILRLLKARFAPDLGPKWPKRGLWGPLNGPKRP